MAVRFEAGASAPTVGRLQRTPAFTGTPYTVVAWFRFDDDSVGSTEPFDFYSTDFLIDDWLELRQPNILRMGTYDSSVDSASNAWQDATWHCMAMTRSATTQAGYVLDRGVVISRSTTYSAAFQVEALLGYLDDNNATGRAVTHYKCWTAALTHDELAREMQQFAPVRTADLVAYAKLEAHTDLSDEIAGSFSAVNATPSTVAGPSGVQDEWTGPRVASSATTAATTSSGGLSCNLPSGVTAGDLLMAFAANDTSVSWSAGGDWSLIDNGANGTAVQGACWAKIAAGSDTLTITGEANDIAVVTIRIPAAQHGVTDVTTITKGTAATGSSNAPNGPNCNPGTSGQWLWLTYYAADDDDNTAMWWPVEGAPVAQHKSATGTSSCMVGVAYRWLEASSYDPSAFTLSASEEWRAQTFAIPAAASSGTYDEDMTDSGALTDASAAMMLLVGSASDSGVLTDTASGQRVSGDAISDSGALTDTAAGGLALAASASDSGALTDAAAGAVSAVKVVSDSVAGSDAAASTWVVGESVTDAADVTDQVTGVGIWLEAASDSAAATDAATAALMLADAVSDPVAATDAATVGLVVAEVLSDSVEATDSAAGQAIYAEAVSDSADLSDTTTGDSGLDASVADSAEASESVSMSLIASDALADAAESSDGVVVTAVYQEVVSDSLSTTESVVGSVGGHSYFESVEDVLEASDSTLATLLSFGASVRSQGGGSGGGRLWTRDLDDEIEAEMGAILKGPPLTPEVIEEITARLDSPPQTRIMEHRRPAKATYSPPVLDFQAVQAKKRRNRQRLLLLL